MNNINVLILGSNGYIGIELVKFLLNHSKVNIKYLCGFTSVGKKFQHLISILRNTSYQKYLNLIKSI